MTDNVDTYLCREKHALQRLAWPVQGRPSLAECAEDQTQATPPSSAAHRRVSGDAFITTGQATVSTPPLSALNSVIVAS